MDVLSKQEVAQNVLEYYRQHKETIRSGLESYNERQGKGFVCWRFLINETAKALAKEKSENRADDMMETNEDESDSLPSGMKRRRSESSDIGISTS